MVKIQDTDTATWLADSKEDSPTLEQAQEFVGGYVEMVPRLRDRQVLVNEEGLMRQLPLNEFVSEMVGYPIVGNAIVLQKEAMWD
jgi:hypothetical protein